MENTNDKTAVQMPDFDEWFNEYSGGAQIRHDKELCDFERVVRAYGAAKAEEARREAAAIYEPIIRDLRKEIARLALNAAQRTARGDAVAEVAAQAIAIDTKALVDAAMAVLDNRGVLRDYTNRGLEVLCTEMQQAFDEVCRGG